MNKINLIIDALELAIRETQHPSLCIDKFDEALAAARELRELEPVAYRFKEDPLDLRSRWMYVAKKKFVPNQAYQTLYAFEGEQV